MSNKLSPYSKSSYDENNTNTVWYKILQMIPENSHVLDVGCSTGNLGAAIKKKLNAKVWGIDITAADVTKAAKVLDGAEVFNVEQDDFNKSKTMQIKYDVVIFADVLEHMIDPVKTLDKIKKLLKPNGRVVFSIPNMAHMFVRLQLLEGSFNYTETGLLDYTHLHFYDHDEVTRIFTDAGYNIEKSDNTTFDYPYELLVEKLKKIGLRPNAEFKKIAYSEQAITFEYIGYAAVSSGKYTRRNYANSTTSPLDEVLAYVQRIKNADKSKINQIKNKLFLTEEHVKKLEETNMALRHQLADISAESRQKRFVKKLFKKK